MIWNSRFMKLRGLACASVVGCLAGFALRGDPRPSTSLDSWGDDSIESALAKTGLVPGLDALLDASLPLQSSEVASYQGSPLAQMAREQVVIDPVGHVRSFGAASSLDALVSCRAFNPSGVGLPSGQMDAIRSMHDEFVFRCGKIEAFRSSIVRREVARLAGGGLLAPAELKDDDETRLFLKNWEVRNGLKEGTSLTLHMRKRLYEGGDGFRAWSVFNDQVYGLSYDDSEPLWVIDACKSYYQKSYLRSLVSLFVGVGALHVDEGRALLGF